MKKFIFPATILALTLSIESCTTTTAAVAGGAAGAAFSDPRSLHAQYDDKSLTYQSQRRMNKYDTIRLDSHISTSTYNGNMLLVGQAPDEKARKLAELESSKIEGVKKIYNRITIQPNISLKDRSEDTWITTKAKTALFSAKEYNLRNIKVVTENKVIYLMGIVDQMQAEKAADVTRQIPGVKKVVKLFEYRNHG